MKIICLDENPQESRLKIIFLPFAFEIGKHSPNNLFLATITLLVINQE
jgi:hypothetical protein